MAFSRSSLISFFSLALFAVFNPTISSRVPSFIKLPSSVESSSSVASYCEGWKLAAETDNAGKWKVVPHQCIHYIKIYYNGGQFDKDYDVVASYAIAYAKTINLAGNGCYFGWNDYS